MRLIVVAVLVAGAAFACSAASSSDDVAACMQAMATLSCPPGTAPTSQSAGDSSTEVGVDYTGVGGSNLQNIGCEYTCAPICQCGIDRVEGDGAVVCSPCYGVEQRALTATGPSGAPSSNQTGNANVVVNPNPSTNSNTQPPSGVVLDFTAAPLYEHHTLTAPFRPDPFAITVQAGGNENIGDANVFDLTGGTCNGFVNAAQPDIAITYYSRGTPLLMSVNSEADTTLIVNMPDGTWRCNDDANNSTLNPRVFLPEGQSGRYSIWVGTYQYDSSFPLAQFRVTARL